MPKILRPFIERRLEGTEPDIELRKSTAKQICHFLELTPDYYFHLKPERVAYEYACQSLLEKKESQRILLYLPFRYLEDASTLFVTAYRKAWYELLKTKDTRENFHLGDCFEADAMPRRGLERVVKCAHLTPWLLKFGYICQPEILDILRKNKGDEVLLQSFKDTWNFIREKQILSDTELDPLVAETAHLPERVKPEPLYVSKKRSRWLREMEEPATPLIPTARLEGPFSLNIPAFESELEEIASTLDPSDIAFVGGSKLKGYGTITSDIDIWKLSQLRMSETLQPGNPYTASICLNTVWVCGKEIEDYFENIANRITGLYSHSEIYAVNPNLRQSAINRLESDLLQYRLLHKGFEWLYGKTKPIAPPEMDGDCPFYDDKYRRIATMLYVKYVWL